VETVVFPSFFLLFSISIKKFIFFEFSIQTEKISHISIEKKEREVFKNEK